MSFVEHRLIKGFYRLSSSKYECHVAKRFFASKPSNINIFDRAHKVKQRANAALRNTQSQRSNDIRRISAQHLVERLSFIQRDFPRILDLGSNAGDFAYELCKEYKEGEPFHEMNSIKSDFKKRIGQIVMLDSCEEMLYRDADPEKFPFNKELDIVRVVADEERFDHSILTPNTYDAVVSNLSINWINDLPQLLKNIKKVLKPDGVFLGCMYGDETVFELRCSLQIAEAERVGGMSNRISPFIRSVDTSRLMTSAGFKMVTVDSEVINLVFEDFYDALKYPNTIGDSSSTHSRAHYLSRDVLLAAAAVNKYLYASNDGIESTFYNVHMIGWKAGENQPQPLPRGTGRKDVL